MSVWRARLILVITALLLLAMLATPVTAEQAPTKPIEISATPRDLLGDKADAYKNIVAPNKTIRWSVYYAPQETHEKTCRHTDLC